MMVMMVVMMSAHHLIVHMTVRFMAVLVFRFQLQCRVTDPMFSQFLADRLFNLVRVGICHNMHGGIVILPVHAPNMDMMNVKDSVDGRNVFFDLPDLDSVRYFFKESIKPLLQVANRIHKNK